MSHRKLFLLILIFIILFSLFMMFGCEKKQTEVTVDWVADTFSSMTETQKIGQLFCLSVDPIKYFLYPDYEEKINTLLSKYKFGAIYLPANIDSVQMETRIEFNGNKLHDELISLQRIAEIPLFVGADFESGAWSWDISATRFPYPLALAAARSGEYAYRQGKITAVEAHAQGINWLISPIMNLSIPSDNCMLQLNSLGGDPDIVRELGSQYITGCQEVGIAACMKFYPSYRHNSLIAQPPVDIGSEQLEVFRAGIQADVLTVMGSPIGLGTELLPDAESSIHTLRTTLGYDGILISELKTSGTELTAHDEMDMLLDAVKAGNTMFLLPEVSGTSIPLLDLINREALHDNVEMTAVDTSVRKILETKYSLNIHHAKEQHTMKSMAGIGLPEYYQNSRNISDDCITLLKNDNDVVPVDQQDTYIVSIAFIGEFSTHFSTIFDNELDKFDANVKHIDIFGIPDDRIRYEAIRRAKEADVIIASFFIKPDSERNNHTLTPEIVDLMEDVTAVNNKVIAVSYYDPYVINQLSDIQSYLVTYSPSVFSIDSTLNVIFGKRGATGKLPITISDTMTVGSGLTSLPAQTE